MQILRSTFSLAPLLGLLALAAPMSACDDSAAENPTWIDDVQPQVLANCIRCHSYPPRGGAPASFRLDVYRNTVTEDGTEIRGAEVMAEFMKQRAGVQGSMPPDFARGSELRDTFKNWFVQNSGSSPARGVRANNTDPNAQLLSEVPIVDKEMVTLEYLAADGDGDVVHGQFTINGVVVAGGLHTGKGTIEFFTGVFPEGDHQIVAEMSDGRSEGEEIRRGFITVYPTRQVIGTLRVRHADGNTAPTVDVFRKHPDKPNDINNLPNPNLVIVGRFNHVLLADSEGPANLEIRVSDPDAADTHTVSIMAFRGDQEVPIEAALAVNGTIDYELDTTGIPEGPGWRLRIVATDNGQASTTFESGTIYISHHTTTETFDTISPLITDSCGVCHIPAGAGGRIPYLNFTLSGLEPATDATDEVKLDYEEFHRKVGYNKGNMYKRMAQEENMPPTSAVGLFARDLELLSDENRARIADYLLGGAPR